MPSLHCLAAIRCLSVLAGGFAQKRTSNQQALAATRFTSISPLSADRTSDALAHSLADGLNTSYDQPVEAIPASKPPSVLCKNTAHAAGRQRLCQ